jgi:hypothetical protein
MTTYTVTDGNGDALTRGLSEHEARATAQRMADWRGESVWLSADRGADQDIEDYEPECEEFSPR